MWWTPWDTFRARVQPLAVGKGRGTGLAALFAAALALAPVLPGMAVGLVTAGKVPPKEILLQADRARGNLDGVQWKVHIDSTENGRKAVRDLKVKAKGYDFLAVITSPPKVRGQKLLMVDRNMWFMKPGLRKPVPISARQKLVGGVVYGDIASTNYAQDYTITALDRETVDGVACYLFDLKAATRKATYDRIRYWVSVHELLGIKAEYYTVSGKLLKTARFRFDNRVNLDGKAQPFVSRMAITDALQPTNQAILSFHDPKIRKVPDSTFDINLLMSR